MTEVIFPFLTSSITPLVWGFAYLGFNGSPQYFVLIAMFSFALYAALAVSFHAYYHEQAALALEAISAAHEHYDLSVADPSEFLAEVGANTLGLATRDIQIIIADRRTRDQNQFLNYRAYLQPRGSGKSVALISRNTAVQRFFLLHELGHLAPVSHHNGLYDSWPKLRLIVTYGPFLCLTPTWWMAALLLAACFVDWFFRGALRREYIADAFAWSALARADQDVRRQARLVATVFRHTTPKDDTEEIELNNRQRMCDAIFKTAPDTNAWIHQDRWLKNEFFIRVGTTLYTYSTGFLQFLLTVLSIWQFDGDPKRIATFLVIAVWCATGLRLWMFNQARAVRERLAIVLAVIPASRRPSPQA